MVAVGRERLVVCALLAAPVVALSTTPGLQFGHWTWICLTLAAPVVVWGGGRPELHEDPTEVAHTYRIGLHQLCRDDSPRFVAIPESNRPVVQLPLGGDLIHAPTAAVLVQFRWVGLDGRVDARVDHFEQPVFAWR